MFFEKALNLDNTTVNQPAACLSTMTMLLEQFKEENPNIWKELCDRGLSFGDLTLQDSLTALEFASGELSKILEQQG